MTEEKLDKLTRAFEWKVNAVLISAFNHQVQGVEMGTDEEGELKNFVETFRAACVLYYGDYKSDVAVAKEIIGGLVGHENLAVRYEPETEMFYFVFSYLQFRLEVEVGYPEKPVKATFNEPKGEAYLIGMAKLHDLCRDHQISYSINYREAQNLWDGALHSSAADEEYQTRDYSLSTVLELMIDHLETLVTK